MADMYDVAVLGCYSNSNYGGSLTVLATYRTVKDLGYSVRMLKLGGHKDDNTLLYNQFVEFTKAKINNADVRRVWNRYFNNFLLCSDWTLFKNWFLPNDIKLFDWVEDNKNKITFASSFGSGKGNYKESDLPKLKERLSRFSALSVREIFGVEICEELGVKAIQMPDPVFSQKKEFYTTLAEAQNHNKITDNYAAVYLLDMDDETIDLALKTAEKLNLKPLFIIPNKDRRAVEKIKGYDYISAGVDGVSSWLYYLSNSDYIITNSFHGICIAMIYRKNFSAINRKRYSPLRVKELLNATDLIDKLIISEEDISKSVNAIMPVDKIDTKLEEYYNKTRNFLKNSIKTPNSTTNTIDNKAIQRFDALERNLCTGCLACVNACPKKCIKSDRDEVSGFIYPKLIETECVNCGICLKACPVLSQTKPSSVENTVFCGYSLNNDIRGNSTSGGFFSEIAIGFFDKYKENAVVFGAAYETPSTICHIEINTPQELPKIRQSKYVQSELRQSYTKIENYLKEGKAVLFCGTPCQCAGILQYLKTKKPDITKLYLVDFVCHSVNAPYAYSSYIEDLSNQRGKKVKSVWFRNKEKSWEIPSTRIDFEETDDYYLKSRKEDDFYKGFLRYNLYPRRSCNNCKFKGVDRITDFTLADAWGVRIEEDSSNGVSTAIIHTDKGRELFEDIKNRLYIEEKSVDIVAKGNAHLNRSSKAGKYSEYFFSRLSQKTPFSQIISEIESRNSTNKDKIDNLIQTETEKTSENIKNSAPEFKIPENVMVNGAIIRAHPTAEIIVKGGAKLILNNDKFPGSESNCLIDLKAGAKIIVEGNFKIYHSCRIVVHKNAVLTLGRGYINTDSKIICSKSITIGNAIIAPDCYIVDSDYHTIQDENGNIINPSAPVKFEGHVWLGQNVTVLKGVTIGTGTCVGAKSLVTKDIPPNSLAVGVPAKVIKSNIKWQ
ncbi:MAG: polysaccharide pyruvyl transferase family protein [Oscillospiraceae bacterium]|nr:polysaccharide pyruvyl transferase family protein [Oscillospiraceae bacterium]